MDWLTKLEKTKKELEDTINLEKRKLMMEKEMVNFQLSSLRDKIRKLEEIEKELSVFKSNRDEILKLEKEKLSKDMFLKSLTGRIDKIKGANEGIKLKYEQTSLKISLLNNPEPVCPICSKDMRYDQKVNMKNRLNEELTQEANLSRRNLEQSGYLEEKKESLEKNIQEIDLKIKEKPMILEKILILEEQIKEVNKEKEGLSELELKKKEIDLALENKSYALMAQKLLSEVNKEIKKSI